MNIDFAEKREALDALSSKILHESIPVAREWGGADVVITSRQPKRRGGSFYSEPRFVVTPNAQQLSWLFYQLRDIFSDTYDGNTKIEFFGRLANAALRYQEKHRGNEDQRSLLFAVLHESFAMLDEMEEGTFQYLSVAVGNTIADDLIERAESRGFIGVDKTKKFFAERGLEL